MAESIVRRRVESQEFESKLKRASQELLAMADNARRTGATFAIADKEELAFVSSLGQLQTSARSAKGSIAEMTKAFQDLSMHYRSLTDEEKAAPYGQELKKSLEQLQNRINDGKKALGEINGTIGESKNKTDILSGAVNDLAGKFGLSVPKLGAMSVAIAGVTGALKVAKDAFFANEQSLDEWEKTTESAKSVYNGFLDALNTGDISGYLGSINQIVDAARKAYDALDELGTYNAFNQVNVSRDKQRLTNAMADYREGKGSKASVQAASADVQKNLRELYLKQQGAYVAKINQLAAERGVSGKALMKIADGSYSDYQRAKNVQMTGTRYQVHTNQYGQSWTTSEKYAKNAAEQMGSALRRINDTDWQELQKLGADAQNTLNELGMTRRQVARILGSGRTTTATTGGRTGGGGGIGNVTPAPDLNKIAFNMDEKFNGGMLQDEINGKIADKVSVALGEVIKSDLKNMDPEQLKAMLQGTETVNDVFKNANMSQVRTTEDRKQGRQDSDISKLAKGVGALSNITSAIQGLGMELPEELTRTVAMIQALMSVIQGVQAIIQVFGSTTQTANTVALGLNTGALGALTATMSANTAANVIPFLAHGGIAGKVVNSKRFAYGGMVVNSQRFAYGGHVSGISKRAADGFVGGNNYSGDLIPIAVNSGELILNRAQQGNLASQLSGMGLGAIEVYGRISGEDINLSSRRRHNRMVRSETTR